MPPPASPAPPLGRQAFSAVAWLSAFNGLGGIGMLALFWWLNRALPDAPMRMGQWSVVLSLLLMTQLVFEGGIPAILQQRKDLEAAALRGLAWFQLLLALAGAGALWLVAGPVARLLAADVDPAETSRFIRLSTLALLAICAGLTPKAMLQRDLRFRTVASIEGGSTLVTIVLAIFLVPSRGIEGLVLATIARHVLETLLYWTLGSIRPWAVYRRASWQAMKDPLRAGAYMGAQSLLGTAVRQGDVLLVGALAGTVTAGVYRQIQLVVVQPHAKLTMFVARATFPALSRLQDDPDRMHRAACRMQRLLALAVLPMQLGLAAVAPRLLAELLGEQYLPHLPQAIPAMMLLCVAAAVTAYAYSLIVALNAAGRGSEVLGRQATGSIALVMFLVAGSFGGLVGIATGRVAAAAFHSALFLGLTRRAFAFGRAALLASIRQALPAALACWLVASGTGLVLDHAWPASAALAEEAAHGARRLALAAQVLAGALAYVAALLLLRLDPRAEWRALRA